jgi:glycosyltransferase involved in cell wall biosynthesis
MDLGRVDVIIPTYNRADLIGKTLDTIFAQTYKNVSVIVIDDGSKDETKSLVESYAKGHPALTYHYKENGGVASARNLGIQRSNADFIAFCDSDDLWRKDKLEKQMPLFSDAAVGLVYSGVSAEVHGNEYDTSKIYELPGGDCYFQILRKNLIPNSSVVVRRRCLSETGFFDERRELMGLEDKHLWLRIAKRYRIKPVREPLFEYQILPQSVSSNFLRMLRAEILCIRDLQEIFPPLNEEEEGHYDEACFLAHMHYAMSLFFHGDYPNARECLKGALELDPLDRDAWLYLAATHLPASIIDGIRTLKRRLRSSDLPLPKY